MKKRVTVIAGIMLLFCFLCFSVTAETSNSDVIYDISPYALENTITEYLNTFTETNEGWDSDTESSNVTLAEKIESFPYTALTGDGCLIVRTKNAQSAQNYYISREFGGSLDLSMYNFVMFTINCGQVENGKYTAFVEMYSDKDQLTSAHSIDANCWNGVIVDISQWENRNAINKIRISVNYESKDTPVSQFEYYVDSITLSQKESLSNAIRYSAEDYSVSGGELEYANGIMGIIADSGTVRLDSENFSYQSLGNGNALRVRFSAKGGCAGVRLYIYGSGNGKPEEVYTSVDGTEDFISAVIPVKTEKIDSVSICFEGTKANELTIYSIQPYSAYESENTSGTGGGIDTCVINSNTQEIIIKGSVNKELLTEDVQRELYLFSHNLSDVVTADILTSDSSLAKSNITSEDFIFRVQYNVDNDKRLFLYKKYTVAMKTENGFQLIGGPRCITNPETFTQEPTPKTNNGSGKGVYGESISFMQEMGVSDTIIWVDIGKFFMQESNAGSSFKCGNNLYYYNSEYFDTLDGMIKNFDEKNIDVTLCFVVSDTGNETLNKLLIHKDADLNARYCAYNTSERTGLMYLRAIAEFFAERYCSDLAVTRVVFGDSVAMSDTNYNMGTKTAGEFVAEYARGLRVVYNAVKSYSPYVEVYTYIDDIWDRGLPYDLYTRFDSCVFIEELNRCITDTGNIGWGIAQNPYPDGEDDYFSYSDSLLEDDGNSDRVSFKNIDVLVSYMKKTGAMYNNSSRDLIIIEKTRFSGFDEKTVTADYVYNCYKALNTSVSAYITDRSCNYNNAMKYIDTSLSLTASSFVSDVLGVATLESVISGFSTDNIVKRKITTDELVFTSPKTKGSIVITDFSADTSGWKRYGFTERITAGSSFSEHDGLLSLMLGNIPEGETRGIVKEFDKPYDMSATPILHFSINIASLPVNVSYANLEILLISGNETYMMTGSVKEAVWTDVYCDFSDASGIGKVDAIKILFRANENYYDSPQALISSIEGLSVEYDSEQLKSLLAPEGQGVRRFDRVKKYAYPVLTVMIIVSICLFIWRRTARKK